MNGVSHFSCTLSKVFSQASYLVLKNDSGILGAQALELDLGSNSSLCDLGQIV